MSILKLISIFHFNQKFNWLYLALFTVCIVLQYYYLIAFYTVIYKIVDFIFAYENDKKRFYWVRKIRHLFYIFTLIYSMFFVYRIIESENYLNMIANILMMLVSIYIFIVTYKKLEK